MKRTTLRRTDIPAVHCGTRQSGAVLLVSLIILVVLTMLGVSTMNSTQLEEKMAANSQEANRAFQAAESGLSSALNDSTAWNTGSNLETVVTLPTANDADAISAGQADTQVSSMGESNPPTDSGYDNTYKAYHFRFQSEACTNPNVTDEDDPADGIADECLAQGGLTMTSQGGGYRIAPGDDGTQLTTSGILTVGLSGGAPDDQHGND